MLTRDEVELPFRDDVEVEDAETGQVVVSNGTRGDDAYRESISGFLERWRTRCATYGIDYVRLFTDHPLDTGLRAYLRRRIAGAARDSLLAPWALAGDVLLAGPVVVHMLLRRNARRVMFPATHFLLATQAAAVRFRRPSDIGLDDPASRDRRGRRPRDCAANRGDAAASRAVECEDLLAR